MPACTCAPTGVAGIELASHPAVENPGVEICAPVAVVFADDCTNHPSCSDTATFSREPCPRALKAHAHTNTHARMLRFCNFTDSPSRTLHKLRGEIDDLQLHSDLAGETAATTEGRLISTLQAASGFGAPYGLAGVKPF